MKDDERVLLFVLQRTNGREFPRDVARALGIPQKRAAYICEKWTGKGWYDYGVSVLTGWLTDEGRRVAPESSGPRHLITREIVDQVSRAGWIVVHAADRVDLCEPVDSTPGRTRVSLQYHKPGEAPAREYIDDGREGGDPRAQDLPEAQPWRVESDGLSRSRAFADFPTACLLFLDQAYAIAAHLASP